MAKINLNPGADSSLVTAAYRAGVGTAPADYSRTFESVARSYDRTMQAQSEMWKNIGKIVSVVGADMVRNAQEWNNYKEVGEKNAAYLVEELEANKQAQKDLGWGANIFGNKETRDKKRRLKSKQRELFAEIDFLASSINTGAESVAAGLFDEELATNDAMMINAIVKSNLKDKITEAGHQAVLSRDEKTDELIFTLLDRDGKPVPNAMNEPTTMSVKEFNRSIATNTKDVNNTVGNNLSTLETDIANLGQKSKNGIFDDQSLQLALNRLDGMLQTDVDLKRAMLSKYGMQGTSFADDIRTPGPVSEDIYVALVKNIGANKSGQVKAEGVLEGIADTDGVLGLSQKEIENAYGVYSTNILGMKDPDVSRAIFKASFADRMSRAHKWGYSKRAGTGEETATDSGLSTLRTGKSTELFGTNKGWVKNDILNSLGTNINSRDNIPLAEGEGEMIWDDKAETYIYKAPDGTSKIINDKTSLFRTFFQSESPVSSTTLQTDWWKSIKDWSGKQTNVVETPFQNVKDLEKANINLELFQKDADDIISTIEGVLPDNYKVVTKRQWTFAGRKGEGILEAPDNAIRIINVDNPDEVYTFKTNWRKQPSKAKEQLNNFYEELKDIIKLKTQTTAGLDLG